MNTTDFEIKDLVNFLLLNAGFSNNNSLQNGKLAVVLFLIYAEKNNAAVIHPDAVVSFLNEIFSGAVPAYNSNTYGTGFAGAGVILEHLTQEELIDYDPDGFLPGIEQAIIKTIETGSQQMIDLATGLSGTGLYLLHRLQGVVMRKSQADVVYKKYLQACVGQIVKLYPAYRPNEYLHQTETAVWNGLTGVLLFLNKAAKWGIKDKNSEYVQTEIVNKLFHQVNGHAFNWSKAEAFFGLLTSDPVHNKNWQDEVFESFLLFVHTAHEHLSDIDFQHAAFIAVLIRFLGQKFNNARTIQLSDILCEHVKTTLAAGDMAALFRNNLFRQILELGVYRGVCGTALCLLSAETNDYNWLKIFGIDIN